MVKNMSKAVYFSSIKKGSGKSAICLGMYLNIKNEKGNPTYFKPIGEPFSSAENVKMDKDVLAVINLLNIPQPANEICPVLLSPEFFFDQVDVENAKNEMKKIEEAFKKLQTKSDVIIIEGNHIFDQFRHINLDDISIAKALNAGMVLVAPLKDDGDFNDLDTAIETAQKNNVKIIGVIINYMSQKNESRIQQYYKPALDKLGVPIVGEIKSFKKLEFPTIEELKNAVNGRIITSVYEEVKDNYVEGYHVAGMGVAAALTYLRKGVNNCVICGGDRTDIILAALEANTAMIIVSGNIEPDPQAIEIANEKKIPIIISANSTFNTVYNVIMNVKKSIQPSELKMCEDLVKNSIKWKEIVK